MIAFEGFAFALNYGLNKVRFPAPVPVGGKVRMTRSSSSVEPMPGGAQMTIELDVRGARAARSPSASPSR